LITAYYLAFTFKGNRCRKKN